MRLKGFVLIWAMVFVVSSSLLLSGCALNFYKQSPRSKKEIGELKTKIGDLEKQRSEERAKFEAVKRMLESKLSGQIANEQVSLKMNENGLVIILSDDILFDSGKATLKSKAHPILDKVAKIIKNNVPDKNIGVSGHTDNVPIKYSKWKSNWELSAARATNVLYYLENKGVSPERLSATGYGEHRSIELNKTASGRARNRRVEIAILPAFVEKKRGEATEAAKEEQLK